MQFSSGELKLSQFNEAYFPEINHLTFEKNWSGDVFAPIFDELFEQESALFVVVGTDSGLLYEYVKNKVKHPDCKFVFIEFDSVIQKLGLQVSQKEELAKENQNVWLFDETFELLKLHSYFQTFVILRKVFASRSLAVAHAQPSSPYARLYQVCEAQIIALDKMEQPYEVKATFETERFLNAAQNLTPVKVLNGSLEGRDVVVIGGGPTLDDSIEWIRENQEKLVIIAAARVAQRMKNEGIQVDFFVTIDPYEWSFHSAKAVLEHYQDSILINAYHAQHRILSQWLGASCYLGELFGWQTDSGEENIEVQGPTVTNASVHTAVMLGASRVFLAGLDFCFAHGKTHESSSPEVQNANKLAHQGKMVLEDNAGNLTETREDFYLAQQTLQQNVADYAKFSKCEIISLGLHSAKIENVSYQPTQAITLAKASKTTFISEIRQQLTLTPMHKKTLVEKTLRHLEKQKKRFLNLNKLSTELVATASGVYRQGMIVEAKAKKFDKLHKKATLLIAEDKDFLTIYRAELFAETMRAFANSEAMTSEETLNELLRYYQGMKQVAKDFLSLIQQGIARCQQRLEELSPKSKPSKLYPLWDKRLEFGRAIEWQWLHPELEDEKELEILQQAIDAYEEYFEKAGHGWQKTLQKNTLDLSKLFERANNAYEKQNLTELQTILTHLNTADVSEIQSGQFDQVDFRNYLIAMSLELQEKPVEAFNLYEPIQDTQLRYLALQKMLSIAMSLQDYDVSLTVLERLVVINAEFMVNYADLLKLLGNLEGAIGVLQMYIQQFPESLSAKNKLAQWLLENQQAEQAKTVLQQVLSQDDTNQAAKALLKNCS